jgi:zinc protease
MAKLDLTQASSTVLDNGLQVIVLEEHSLPVVSVQMFYKVGARNEQYGLTGISHYLEHMAFRATENFPGTEVVGRIYAVGGEWHAYTWIDQTIYYDTLPSEHLDLALRIQADRMERLVIPEEMVDPERGAIFAEMHGYENDPSSPLRDTVVAASLLAHPYRNNVMGSVSDLNNTGHAELVDMYERHYHPGNAVLTIVGDIDGKATLDRVRELFGGFEKTVAAPLPATVEPPQTGERRIKLTASSDEQHFEIAYQAPAVGHADFAAFLLVREILCGAGGLNAQHDLGFAGTRTGSYLGEGLTTWFHATRQPFLFTISGAVEMEASQAETEASVERQVSRLRDEAVGAETLEQARRHLLEQMIYDVQTTEDAAHQLGYFAGIDALDVLHGLPQAIAGVDAADIQRVARRYLAPSQRTIGWSVPSAGALELLAEHPAKKLAAPAVRKLAPQRAEATGYEHPELKRLSAGLPVIVRHHSLAASAYLAVVYPAPNVSFDGPAVTDAGVSGYAMQAFQVLPGELAAAIASARHSLDTASLEDVGTESVSNDPWSRLSQAINQAGGITGAQAEGAVTPALIVAVGDFDAGEVLAQLETAFGDITPTQGLEEPLPAPRFEDLEVTTVLPKSQAQIAYVVPAPAPGDASYDTWRFAAYVLSHAYEGRLGKKAISDTGLLYWIENEYATDGQNGWIVTRSGVDPDKLAEVKKMFAAEIARLVEEPPTEAEIAEARNHFLGRQQSAAQSNAEIARRLVHDWLTRGEIVSMASLRARLNAVSRKDVTAILPAFSSGAYVTVKVDGQPKD